MSTPPFPTPPRAITHAELLAELEAVKKLERIADQDRDEDCQAYYQGQRHLLMRLLKMAEGG